MAPEAWYIIAMGISIVNAIAISHWWLLAEIRKAFRESRSEW
ncbi:MAG: hypothetical protein OXP09_11780 [Gammaproteobacteria bacterium]|nr:hypothetical protein [Gammaproteobacteria bacterium]